MTTAPAVPPAIRVHSTVETVTLTETVRAVLPVAGTTAWTSGTEPRVMLTAVSDYSIFNKQINFKPFTAITRTQKSR